MPYADQLEMLGIVALAGLLGGLIGFEREHANKPAGLRTHMLACAASAMFVLLGQIVIEQVAEKHVGRVNADPTRIVHGIIVGVSFLGAGTIFVSRGRDRVRGLTTAASILLTVGVGIAAALYQLVLAIGVTVITLVVLRLLGAIERRVRGKHTSSQEIRHDR